MTRSVYLNTVINLSYGRLLQFQQCDERSLYSTAVVDLFTSSATDAWCMFFMSFVMWQIASLVPYKTGRLRILINKRIPRSEFIFLFY